MNTSVSHILELPSLSKRNLLLFVFLELLVLSGILFFHYRNTLVLLALVTFLFLNFLDVRITLWFLIAFSVLVAYQRGAVTAAMMIALGSAYIFVCLSVFLKFCLGEIGMEKTKLNLPVAVFLIMVFFQTLRGILSSYPIKWLLIEFLAYSGFGIMFLVINVCDKKEIIKRFFQLFVVVAYYQALMGLWVFFRVGHRIGGYLFGTFPSLTALVLLNLSFYAKEKSKKRIYILISLPLILHLLFSFTRGYWMGFICALLFSYGIYLSHSEYSIRVKVWRLLKGTIMFILTLSVLLIGVKAIRPQGNLLSSLSRRFISAFSTRLSSTTASNFSRLLEYRACLERIKDSPILGYGVGYRFPFRDPLFQKRMIASAIVHQFYLMITLKMGLVGLLVFLWMYYVFFKEGLNGSKKIEDSYYKGLSYGFMANSIELLAISFTNSEFASVINNFYIAFTIGAVVVITIKRS